MRLVGPPITSICEMHQVGPNFYMLVGNYVNIKRKCLRLAWEQKLSLRIRVCETYSGVHAAVRFVEIARESERVSTNSFGANVLYSDGIVFELDLEVWAFFSRRCLHLQR